MEKASSLHHKKKSGLSLEVPQRSNRNIVNVVMNKIETIKTRIIFVFPLSHLKIMNNTPEENFSRRTRNSRV